MSAKTPDEKLLEEAAGWFLRQRQSTAQHEDQTFRAWLSDADHAAAFNEICDAWYDIDEVADAPELLLIRERALDRAPATQASAWGMTSRRQIAAGIAALVAAPAAYALLKPAPVNASTYSTRRGEKRKIVLEEGRELTLDANSSVTIHIQDGRCVAELHSGRALFAATSGGGHPFRVFAGEHCVSGLGFGTFSVDHAADRLTILVVSGAAAVQPGRNGNEPVGQPRHLGRQAELTIRSDGRATLVRNVHLTAALGWLDGKLTFEDEPLSLIAARMNNYAEIPLQIGDPEVGNMRLSGTFNAGDSVALADAVRSYLGIQVLYGSDVIILSKTGRDT